MGLRLTPPRHQTPALLLPPMCPECATFNYKKRIQTADLKGRIALMTGALPPCYIYSLFIYLFFLYR